MTDMPIGRSEWTRRSLGEPEIPRPSYAAVRTRRGVYPLVKAVVEWLCAVLLFAPALLVLAGLVIPLKLTSRGPIFYSQVRLGRMGRPFRIFKIRTMMNGCERATGPVWAAADDPRITRLGRWLRDTHLDELPQLWNILRGEMGLIGPRPERPEIASQIRRKIPSYRDRLLVRPGITGLAQMRLPADFDIDAVGLKLSHDLWYVEKLSVGLDVRIAISTALHFVGWAAMAASRKLVQPFVPERFEEPRIVVTRLNQTSPARRRDDRRAAERESAEAMAA
jgi:lipopolysaccharide/colanic/teichoic acid biosynthesis glycosyltransferase